MTLTQLSYILAVDTHQQFGLAAKACGISQPTLSMQIQKLEDELGLRIFDRSRKPVVATEAGELYIAQAKKVLLESHKLQDLVSQLKGTLQGTLKIGIIPTLAPYLLPYAAGEFARTYPDIRFQVEELTTEKIIASLKSDKLDAGILVTPLDDDSIKEKPLFYEEIYLYVNPEHELSSLAEASLQDLAQPNMWLLSSGHCFRHQMLNLCSRHPEADSLPFKFEGGSLETLRRLVDTEGGFTLLPELATQELNEEQQDNLRRLASPRPLREVSLVHARTQAKSRMLEALQEIILQHLPASLQKAERGVVVKWK
jgi:LysR family hydrogen peroxide-inducible transcriptional activator